MIVENICMLLSSSFELLTHIHQIKYNKQKRSIYGLSYDYILLTWISYATSVVSSLNYHLNPIVIREYRNRFPVHSEAYVSLPVLLEEILGLLVVTGLLIQLVMYLETKHESQGISDILKGILFIGMVSFIWVLKMYLKEQNAILLLDLIDYCWFASKLTSCIRFFPQILMNGIEYRWAGLSDTFFGCQLTSLLLLALGKYSSLKQHWYSIPVNYNTWNYLFVSPFCLSLLFYQKRLMNGSMSTQKFNKETSLA